MQFELKFSQHRDLQTLGSAFVTLASAPQFSLNRGTLRSHKLEQQSPGLCWNKGILLGASSIIKWHFRHGGRLCVLRPAVLQCSLTQSNSPVKQAGPSPQRGRRVVCSDGKRCTLHLKTSPHTTAMECVRREILKKSVTLNYLLV